MPAPRQTLSHCIIKTLSSVVIMNLAPHPYPPLSRRGLKVKFDGEKVV